MFTVQEADYAYLFYREPSFPHTAFEMAADQAWLDAYAAALSATLGRAAKDKRAAQEPCSSSSTSSSSSSATPAWQQQETSEVELTVHVLDVGCGCGVLSLLAAAAGASLAPHSQASSPSTVPTAARMATSVVGVEMVAPLAAAAQRTVAANRAAGSVSIVHGDAASLQRGVQLPLAGADIIVLNVFDAGERLRVAAVGFCSSWCACHCLW
jgi:SAM-dependent methyltransferase